MIFVTSNYADFKLVAAQFTAGKVFFVSIAGPPALFKAWGMASGFPVLVLSLQTQPGTWAADFPSAVQLATTLGTQIG